MMHQRVQRLLPMANRRRARSAVVPRSSPNALQRAPMALYQHRLKRAALNPRRSNLLQNPSGHRKVQMASYQQRLRRITNLLRNPSGHPKVQMASYRHPLRQAPQKVLTQLKQRLNLRRGAAERAVSLLQARGAKICVGRRQMQAELADGLAAEVGVPAEAEAEAEVAAGA